jgi:hypothetical protein
MGPPVPGAADAPVNPPPCTPSPGSVGAGGLRGLEGCRSAMLMTLSL